MELNGGFVLQAYFYSWLVDLYHLTPLNDLVGDTIYSGFVIPKYSELQQYAEAEHQRAEQANLLAQQESQRAQQESARA